MKERPILFSTPMVKAVLTEIKDITRRTSGLDVVNDELTGEVKLSGTFVDINGKLIAAFNDGYRLIHCACPYGQPGDILWVRETFRYCQPYGCESLNYEYKTGETGVAVDPAIHYKINDYDKWRPSIHMPKEACRLKRKIVSIRVERLHEITEEDAVREGIPASRSTTSKGMFHMPSAKHLFNKLWVSINSQESWDSNPWVWRIEFQKL